MSIDIHVPPDSEATATVGTVVDPAGPEDTELELPPGTRVGRYLIVERIGAGAMGLVYAAYDPELDRRIAIKLLRARFWRRSGRERVLREAQALAKLSHPNVVAIHDVGTIDDQMFVAMELIDGEPLGAWLARAPRRWREVVRVMVQAGRGIAAAHEAGVVHRDVKPDNIIVSASGQARVLDFGVALDTQDRERADHVAGTPAYMAPEHREGAATASSDQYGFCVTLSEALYGVRPQAEATTQAGSVSTSPSPRSGRDRKPSALGRPSARVRRALRRGLRHDPARRYPSMTALLADLDRAVRRRLVTALVAPLGLASVAVAATAVIAARDDPAARCRSAGDAVDRIWSRDARAAVGRAFSGAGGSHAADTSQRVLALIDARAEAWAVTRRGVCEATWARGEQSEALLDLRMHCLDRRLNETTALVELFSRDVDRELSERAVQAVYALEPVKACATVVHDDIASASPGFDSPAQRARLAALHKRIDELEVLRVAGRYRQAMEAGEAVMADADRLGSPVARAEVLLTMGMVYAGAGHYDRSKATYARGVVAAARAGDPRREALMTVKRLWVIGSGEDRHAAALDMVAEAEAAVIRAGDAPQLRAELDKSVGAIYIRKGDYELSAEHTRRALAIYERVWGRDDPRAAPALNNLGLAAYLLGDYDEAIRHLERARAVREAALGPEHPAVAAGLNNLGLAYLHAGREDEARQAYTRALELLERAHGPDHPDVASALDNLGMALSWRGENAEAEAYHRRALAIREARLGPRHQSIGVSLLNIAGALNGRRERAEALAYYRRALAMLEATVDPDHELTRNALLGLGSTHLGAGDPRAAIAPLERALALAEAADSPDAPSARFTLAQALWSSPRAHARALELARSARAAWAERADSDESVRAVDAWLQSRDSR